MKAESYADAKPFPHVVIRDAWDVDLLRRCKQEINEITEWDGERDFAHARAKKYKSINLPKSVQAVIDVAHSEWFLRSLEDITGEQNLMVDPMLFGGGVHRIGRGGFLKHHVDFNTREGSYRRLNLLLYLNDWQDQWGGHLELVGESVKRISPQINTMVIFTTDTDSWHGHPNPLRCPETEHRDSIALYYYTLELRDRQTRRSTLYA